MEQRRKRIIPTGLGTVLAAMVVLATLLACLTSEAQGIRRRHHVRRNQELTGGVGFAADLTTFTPGGFKWFNEYGHHVRGPTWFNAQINLTLGDDGRCRYYRYDHSWVCRDDPYFDGRALELVVGAKLKWRPGRTRLQLHAKFGGGANLIWFDAFYGVAVAFRSGFGLRYFFVPTLSAGVEVAGAVGPAFLGHDIGTRIYGAVDVNFGVEWRF